MPRNLSLLKEKGVTVLITTDMALDQYPKPIEEVSSFAKVIIIDHHKIYSDINSDRICMIKAEYVDESIVAAKYPTAKLCYDLFSRVVDMSKYDWISCIGVISDIASEQWKDFVNEVFAKYKVEWKDNIFDTTLGSVGSMLSLVECNDVRKVKDCFEVLNAASNFGEGSFSRPATCC